MHRGSGIQMTRDPCASGVREHPHSVPTSEGSLLGSARSTIRKCATANRGIGDHIKTVENDQRDQPSEERFNNPARHHA